MQVITKNIKELISAEYNPRQLKKEQFKQLKDSIQRFGLVDPVIINKNKDRKNIIIGGHQRTRVAESLGIEKVPCVEVDLTLDEERELNVRLNKNTGEWDYDILADLFDMDELKDWGFSDDELVGFAPDEDKEGDIDDDEIPEVEEAVTKLGDLWILGEHRLLCGDATKEEDVDLLMDGNKADMVFTDPPYNIDYGNIKHPKFKMRSIENDNMTKKDYASFCNKFINIIKNICDGCIYVCHAPNVDGRIIATVLDEILHCSTTIIWNKDTFTLGRGKYQNKYEPIWFGWNVSGDNFSKKRDLVNVWDMVRPKSSKLHPTMKPIELVVRAIKDSSSNNHIIYDSFLGSGSTLIACEKTNRKCYGMELDPHYCDVIVKRWEEFTGKKAELYGKTEEV